MVPGKEEIPIGKRSRILSLPFLGLVLVGFVSSGLLDFLPPLVRVFCVLFLFSYLPGEVILRRFVHRRWSRVELRVPLSVLVGLSFFSAVTWLCWLTGMSLGLYLTIIQLVMAGLFGLFLCERLWRGGSKRDEPAPGSGCVQRTKSAILVCVAAGVAIFFLVLPPALSYQGDGYVHVGYVRSMVDDNSLEPGDVLGPVGVNAPRADGAGGTAAVMNGEADSGAADPRCGTLHLMLAGCSVLAFVDALTLWLLLPVMLAPVAVLAFASFASALLPSAGYLLFALLLFLMFQGGLGRAFLGDIAYGQHLALVFYWVLFVVCLESRFRGSRRDLGVVLMVLFGGALIHVDVAIHFGLMFLSFVCFKRVFGFSWKPLIALGIGALVCAGVVFVWKIVTSYSGGNELHSHPQGLLYFFEVGDRFFVVSPAEIIRRNGLIFFAGLALLVPLLFMTRHKRAARMNIALAAPPLLIALNPWVAPFVYSHATYLLHRFLLNIPALTITALVIGTIVAWGRQGRLLHKTAAIVMVFLWARVFLVGVSAWTGDMRSAVAGRGEPVLTRPVVKAARFINNRVPKDAVVLSDPVTSYALSGFTHAKVVAVLSQHGNPNDRHAFARLEAIQTVLSPYTTQMESIFAVRRFNVDYILVNGSFEKPIHEFMADWDPAFAPTLRNKFGTLRDVFEKVYDNEDITIFKVIGTEVNRITWDAVVPFIGNIPDGLERCEEWPPENPVEVTGIRIDPPVALPGEEVDVTISYRRAHDTKTLLPLWLHLRFEDREYFDTTGSYPGDKYVRRYRERRDAAFRRFRISRRVFDGFYPVLSWPWSDECYEKFRVRLPTDLLETGYEVQCKLTEEPLVTNFAFADFVYNEDSFVGTPCTELQIKKNITR